jgi:hypothetical protein
MSDEPAEDERVFGKGVWVYCKSHMRPHCTGWCTVDPRDKVAIEATNYAQAYVECKAKGYSIFGDDKP